MLEEIEVTEAIDKPKDKREVEEAIVGIEFKDKILIKINIEDLIKKVEDTEEIVKIMVEETEKVNKEVTEETDKDNKEIIEETDKDNKEGEITEETDKANKEVTEETDKDNKEVTEETDKDNKEGGIIEETGKVNKETEILEETGKEVLKEETMGMKMVMETTKTSTEAREMAEMVEINLKINQLWRAILQKNLKIQTLS
jgi:hypothetical protein